MDVTHRGWAKNSEQMLSQDYPSEEWSSFSNQAQKGENSILRTMVNAGAQEVRQKKTTSKSWSSGTILKNASRLSITVLSVLIVYLLLSGILTEEVVVTKAKQWWSHRH